MSVGTITPDATIDSFIADMTAVITDSTDATTISTGGVAIMVGIGTVIMDVDTEATMDTSGLPTFPSDFNQSSSTRLSYSMLTETGIDRCRNSDVATKQSVAFSSGRQRFVHAVMLADTSRTNSLRELGSLPKGMRNAESSQPFLSTLNP